MSDIRDSASSTRPIVRAPARPENLDIAEFLLSMTELPGSTEPAVVFASLSERCVPAFSDRCSIDIVEGDGSHRIDHPLTAEDGQAAPAVLCSIRTPIRAVGDSDTGFAGVVEHAWYEHRSNQLDVVLARLVVDRATAAVSRERLTGVARAAEDKSMHLERALANSRRIGTALGVLMALDKITEADAFEKLRTQSQRQNRKLHELASDVVDTGRLEQL